MLTQEQILEKLKQMISEKRLKHSLGVKTVAVHLASTYGVDIEKVSIAALLHDCAKGYNLEQSVELCKELDVELDEITRKCEKLIHAPLGAKIAKVQFGIEDTDILDAIAYHTTGRENMSIFEKIICLSDYIEPLRDFPGVERMRETAYKDIDRALVMALESTIKNVLSKNELLHPKTVIARNSLIIEK